MLSSQSEALLVDRDCLDCATVAFFLSLPTLVDRGLVRMEEHPSDSSGPVHFHLTPTDAGRRLIEQHRDLLGQWAEIPLSRVRIVDSHRTRRHSSLPRWRGRLAMLSAGALGVAAGLALAAAMAVAMTR
jgi:hypothetical protein